MTDHYQLDAWADAFDRIHRKPVLIDDQPVTDMPEFCTRAECYSKPRPVQIGEFMVCTSCHYSYGEAPNGTDSVLAADDQSARS